MARAACVERAGAEMPEVAEARAQLVQKEQDLLLAAELGKALLEKNEQLSGENERMAAEYARHLEDLEQERHSLRLQMSAMESGHEAQVGQLQTDIAAIRQQRETQQHDGKDTDKQRSQILEDITEQNQRLTRQLRDAMKSEKQLTQQIDQLRGQQDLRRNSFEFHVSNADGMRDEIAALSERRLDLERQLRGLLDERALLTARLQESAERQLLLERLQRERRGQARSTRRQLAQLAAANSSMTERLEVASGLSPASTGHTSLRNELDSSVDEGLGSGSHLPSGVTLMELGDSVECDEPLVTFAGSPELSELSELLQLRQEARETARQLAALAELARAGRAETDSTATEHTAPAEHTASGERTAPTEVPQLDQGGPGKLREAFQLLHEQVTALLPSVADVADVADGCAGCGRPAHLPLETQLLTMRKSHDQLQEQSRLQTDTLAQLEDELARHSHQLTMREKQYAALQEEKNLLKTELDDTYVAKEDLVRKAWEARDQAVRRKNSAELELSRVRIEVMQTNSQLLESIQRKVRLSCQLDQWQWDMQQLVDAEIQKKLSRNEHKRTTNFSTRSAPPSKGRSILRFFGRS